MTTTADIVATARTYLGTPFHHKGRKLGVGIDCVGIGICIAKKHNLEHDDPKYYPRRPDGKKLMELLGKYLDPGILGQVGNVLVFEFLGPEWPSHIGLRTAPGMVLHAYSEAQQRGVFGEGRVIEHPLDAWWNAKIVAEFKFRGLED